MIKFIKWVDNKLNSKISIQLIVSFIGMFLIIFILSSLLIYLGIVNILRNNSKDNSIKQFQQNQYNIATFVNQVDLLSRQLVMNDQLQILFNNEAAPNAEEVIQNQHMLALMSTTLSDFQFIDSIVYYGANGLVLKASSDQNIVKFDKNGSTDKFFASEGKNMLQSNNLQLFWFGGYTSSDFGIYSITSSPSGGSNDYYMSAARIVYGQTVTGILALNINMEYFSSIYFHNNNSQSENSYMINSAGKIISDSNSAKIGKQSATYRQINLYKDIQSFTITDGKQQKQVVYYRLGVSDWVLVDEIPLKVIEKDISNLQIILWITLFSSLILAGVMSRYWIFKLIKPLNQVTRAMKKMARGDLGLTLEIESENEMGILIEQFNRMSTSIQVLMKQNIEVQESKRRIEMEALRSQINPHFIYNTLNTIKWMAVIQNADSVVESLATLSDFLKPIFKSGEITCNMEEEINYILNYIKIMNYRYTGRFQLNVNIPDDLYECQILRFILQPLVENAIEHGFVNRNGGVIDISAWEEQQTIRIKVSDNGRGLSEEKTSEIVQTLEHGTVSVVDGNNRVGLVNVHRRIRLHYGEPYGLTIHGQKDVGTEVTIIMPFVPKS